MAIDVYQLVTDQVIGLLEAGTVPWKKPWKGQNLHPCNGLSAAKYRGINPFLLEVSKFCGGYADHRWVTFKQAKDAGGNVMKGEKSTVIVFWSWFDTKPADGAEPERRAFLKHFRVFNVEQCENINPAKLKAQPDVYEPTAWESIESAEGISSSYMARESIVLESGGNRAFYSPGRDVIGMPDRDRFEVPGDYHSTLFHELTHSTGHEKRLNRGLSMESGSYAKEELIAELGAAFLCGETGILPTTVDNTAAYLQGWLKVLKGDKKLIPSAASAAQKSTDLILGRSYQQAEQSETVEAQAD